ncbi:hypothetical protein IW262DRAFT_637123 [Armillaria fumosa]|nr:hypothetical protein IW262DRAFT_637123 [Armillaria fumosa]
MFPQPHALLALALFFRPFFVSQTEAKSLTPSGNQYYCCQASWTDDQEIFGQECVQYSCKAVHELCCSSVAEVRAVSSHVIHVADEHLEEQHSDKLHPIRSHFSVPAVGGTSIPLPFTTYCTGSEYDPFRFHIPPSFSTNQKKRGDWIFCIEIPPAERCVITYCVT